MSVSKLVKGFQFNFWVVCIMEMFERLPFFAVRAVIPFYMVYGATQNGLGLSYSEKGVIFTVWAAFQSLIPLFSGAFTDNFGYKKSLVTAFTINIAGYLLMAYSYDFWSILFASSMVGFGTAIFKPPVQGTIAKSVTEETSSLGFGIFYWIVNIGGFVAPFMASALRGDEHNYTWKFVFYGAAAVTLVNVFVAIFIYREPEIQKGKTVKDVGRDILKTLSDLDFLFFLLIFSGFWLMFMQLWDLLPNFIDEWVNSSQLAQFLPEFMKDKGNVKAEQIININAFCIILFMIPWSFVTGKLPRLAAIVIGMVISSFAFIGSGMFIGGSVVALMIVLFSFGEMTCSPKFSEYIGVNAPPEKKAMYMGYSNIPFAIGWMVGNSVSGPLYDKFSNKKLIALDYLKNHMSIPLAELKGVIQNYITQNPDKLTEKDLAKITLENFDFMPTLVTKLSISSVKATELLWDIYQPWKIWPILGSFGFLSIILMLIYSYKKKRKSQQI